LEKEHDFITQIQIIKSAIYDHHRTIPIPSQLMFGWSFISAVLIFATPLILNNTLSQFIFIGLFYTFFFTAGILLEFAFIKKINSRHSISFSQTQKHIISIHIISGILGILMTLFFIEYKVLEMIYIFWIFWIGIADFTVGFLTKPFIQKTGISLVITGSILLLFLLLLKNHNFLYIQKNLFSEITQYICFASISLTHLWMGIRLKKEVYV
jgi:hypothetical protein